MWRFLWRAAALCTALGVSAQAAEECGFPRAAEFGSLRLAQVTVARAMFTTAGGAPLPGRPYVVQGDLVIQGPSQGGRRCTLWLPLPGAPTDETRGFLRDTQVRPVPAGPLTGRWTAGRPDLFIEIRPGGQVSGQALRFLPSGSANVGEMQGGLTLRGATWVYRSAGCEVTMRPLGPWLLVADDWLQKPDDRRCGGVGVSFSGWYRREP
ncbi:hypothetical protein [Deinococcus aquaedulcis]|uniref:hypothetical protein n=1 Tax=Deinococcus aquaedulcis TaxID=2840455 RepID=UPI001C83ECB9|nr:hypothetical protein [Deinococcus aquaedulcis]